jgi:adenylate cyclase
MSRPGWRDWQYQVASASRRGSREDAAGKLDLAFEDIGEQQLKNIARPVRVYRLVTAPGRAMTRPGTDPPLPDKPSIAVLTWST